MDILVDTGAFYALADHSDQYHQQALAFYTVSCQTDRLLTTDYILVETWTLLHHRLGRPAAMKFWDSLSRGMIPLVGVTRQDLDQARRIAHAYADQDFSLVDCTAMAVMERLHIDRVFAFDTHFEIYRYGPQRERHFIRVP